jgi:ribosome-binding protein aMBF1 (putative translation factor)
MKATLKEIIRRKDALISGTARPGRVTQLVPGATRSTTLRARGGYARRLVNPDSFRKGQAANYAAGVFAAREKLGLTQHEMAVLLGISPRTLQNWEQGQREPDQAAKILLRVASKHPHVVLEAV